MKRLVLILFLLAKLTIAQDMVTLFHDYIPEKIIQTEKNKKYLNENLELYASIDPVLIYYFLMTYRYKIERKIANPDSNFTSLFQKKLSVAKKIKSDWATTNIALIDQLIRPELKARRIKSYFTPYKYKFVRSAIPQKLQTFDVNEMNFIRYVYLKNEQGLKYDSSVDYSKLAAQAAQKKVEEFNTRYSHLDELSKAEAQSFIKEAFKYPFLFKGTYLEQYTPVTDFYIYELIERIIREDYINPRKFSIQLAYINIPFTQNYEVRFTDPFKTEFKYNNEIEITSKLYAMLGLKIMRSIDFESFSYLHLNIGASFLTNAKPKYEEIVIFNGIRAIQGLSFQGRYLAQNYRDYKFLTILSQLTFPVYYINHQFFIETGLIYLFQNLRYSYDFVIDGTVNNPYGGELPEFFQNPVQTIKVNTTKHLIYPAILLNYYPLKMLSIQVNYYIPLTLGLMLGFHF